MPLGAGRKGGKLQSRPESGRNSCRNSSDGENNSKDDSRLTRNSVNPQKEVSAEDKFKKKMGHLFKGV